MPQIPPPLIPTPVEFHYVTEGGAFTFDTHAPIQLGLNAGNETLFAARELQRAVQAATGLMLPMRKTGEAQHGRGLSLLLQGRDNDVEFEGGPEAYRLRVDARGIRVVGTTEAGLFYGVQTLKQLLRTRGGQIPALVVTDEPVLSHRGVMLDVSRGKVPTLETLFRLVEGLAAYKYNQLQLYTEHTFHFPSHPDIGAGCDPLTAEDMRSLDEYCRDRHVELVPNLQSFGHQRHLLSLPRYSHLDEVGWRWSLTPARDETYRLLSDLYTDFLPAFSATWLNVDCDETWDLGTGQSKELSEKLGKGRIYLQHIQRLRELAGQHNRSIMLWADVLHHYPQLVPELPDDVLLLDWHYEASDSYPTTEALNTSGRPYWVCPGTSSWNTLFPRLDNAVGNIQHFVRDGLQNRATGMLLTDWGDYGHYQPLSLSWYPYLFGAATAWTGARTSPEEFDGAFAQLFLGLPAGHVAVSAMRRLGKAMTGPTLGLPNRSAVALALFDDPLLAPRSARLDAEALSEVTAAADDAVEAWATLPDADLRHDYGFVARLVAFAAARALEARQHHSIEKLELDRARATALRSEFESVWLRHARRSEIHLTLQHFDALDNAYAAALAWVRQQRDPSAYVPPKLAPLWEQGYAELRHLAELAGEGALPEDVRAWLARADAVNA